MARATIDAGGCGFTTTVETSMNGHTCHVEIDSDCKSIQKLATELAQVDPFREFTYRGEGPLTLALGARHCAHAACPVPVGIIKAVEVAAGLALPADASITFAQDE